MMKTILLSGAAALAALTATSAGAANLVTNGNFANLGGTYTQNTGLGADDVLTAGGNDLPNWIAFSGPDGGGNDMWIQPGNSYGLTESPGNGSGYFIDLTGQANTKAYGGLEQDITTVAGQSYVLTFALGADTQYNSGDFSPAVLSASAGDTTQSFSLTPTGNNQWATETMDFTATSNSTTISFVADSDFTSEYVGLDNVSVVGVPEPATWALMLVGFGGMGAALRMARRKTVAATA